MVAERSFGANPSLGLALQYAGRGWPVFPIAAGAKTPLTDHGYLDASTDPAAITAWWQRWPTANIAAPTGVAFDVLDVDTPEGRRILRELVPEGLPCGPVVRTGGGGRHYLMRPSGRRCRVRFLPGLDFKGLGGYVLLAGSLTSRLYRWLRPPGALLPEVPAVVLDLLAPVDYQDGAQQPAEGVGRGPTTRYGRAALEREAAEVEQAPEGGRNGRLNLAAFRIGQLILEGAVNLAEARDRLARAGIAAGLEPREVRATVDSGLRGGLRRPRIRGGSTDGATATPSSWAPVDLGPILTRGYAHPSPVVLARDDGACLFYAGKVHWVHGETESLKSWLLLVASAQELEAGHHVIYLDFEDSEAGIVGRLLALGVAPAAVRALFHYVRPAEAISPAGWAALEPFLGMGPSLAVVDGVTDVMALHGHDGDKNAEVARFLVELARPLAARGPAVVALDHVVKRKDERGRWAIGGQHKLAGVDGAAYTVELVRPFGVGRHGIARVSVAKDRPGRVREHAAGAIMVDLHLRSRPDGSVVAELTAPEQASGSTRPIELMRQISEALDAWPEGGPGPSANALLSSLKGKTDTKRLALERLEAEGYIEGKPGKGNTVHYRSVRPFSALAIRFPEQGKE